MARPKNVEKRDSIEREAHRQFVECGYNATSYASIASACGVPRTVVQSFFSKKDQLVLSFFERMWAFSATWIVENASRYALESTDGPLGLYLVGQINFAFFTHPEGARTFFFEILADRGLTSTVDVFGHEYTLKFLNRVQSSENYQQILADQLRSLGGEYELMYYQLGNNLPVNAGEVSRRMIDHSLRAFGEQPLSPSEYERLRIPMEDYRDIALWMRAKFVEG